MDRDDLEALVTSSSMHLDHLTAGRTTDLYKDGDRTYDLEDRSLHAAISEHLSGDFTHPKRMAFVTQYCAGMLFVIYGLATPFFPRHHLASHAVHAIEGDGDSGFGRNWLAFWFLFMGIHQFALGYASSLSLRLQSHDIEYYEHNFWGVLAWLMGGLSHVARVFLLWDVMRAHGHGMTTSTHLLIGASCILIVVYFWKAYRSSLSARVAAITAALSSFFLSIALFHASSLNHVAPSSATGAAMGLTAYALITYPMMAGVVSQKYVYLLECANILCFTWLLLCYQAFDNCTA